MDFNRENPSFFAKYFNGNYRKNEFYKKKNTTIKEKEEIKRARDDSHLYRNM